MFCWHDWEKWSEPHNGIFGAKNEYGYFAVCQMRICRKCGKAEYRRLPKMRSLDELRKTAES